MIRVLGLGLALVAGLSGGALAMNQDHNSPAIRCTVERAGKLPAGVTADSICAAIRSAASAALQRSGTAMEPLTVEVTVESERQLVAAARLGGKALPEHRVGISDRALNARAVTMLATAIAAEIASARQ